MARRSHVQRRHKQPAQLLGPKGVRGRPSGASAGAPQLGSAATPLASLLDLRSQAKAFAAGVSEIELKVLEATNEDKWGPHGNDMKGGCEQVEA